MKNLSIALKRSFSAAMLCLLTAVPVLAQELVEVVPLSLDELPELNYFPSPDGQRLLYHAGEADGPLTLLEVSTGDITLIELPEEEGIPVRLPSYGGSYFVPVQWSPDGSQFVFFGTDLVRLREGDLWVYTLETAEWTNLTDDGFAPDTLSDVMFGQIDPDPSAPFWMDAQAAWSHDGRSITFEQTPLIAGEDRPATGIAIANVETGEVRQVAILPRPERDLANMGSVTGLAWSLDDTSLYITVLGGRDDAYADGMYQLDIASGEFDKLQLPSEMSAALQNASGIPVENRILGAPLTLSPDGDQLLVWLGMTSGRFIYWPFIFDLASETFTPVVPFNDSGEVLGQDLTPQHTVWSPDGDSVLVLGVSHADDLDVADLLPDAENFVLGRYGVVADSFELLGRLPQLPAVPRSGAWGADGHVLLGGFQFQFE